MAKWLTRLSLLLLIPLSSCIDGGANPEWATWRSYELVNRITLLVPPDWQGPQYFYSDYCGVSFSRGGDGLTLYFGIALPYQYNEPYLPEYAAFPTIIDGRKATLETWLQPADTSFMLYLWVEEADKDLTKYAAFSKCYSRERRELVQKILGTVRFQVPKWAPLNAQQGQSCSTPADTAPGARLTRR